MLPGRVREPLQDHLRAVKGQHDRDLSAGLGAVALPGDLRSKYPRAAFEWPWQWLFPATRFYEDRETGERRRRAIPSGIRLRHICWRPGMTSGRSRSCSAIAI